jgi:uncharacterized membrane protein YgdD (TMEM256/DUF423 family)
MYKSKKFWPIFAGLNGFMAIAMGALAAHAISDAHAASLAEKASYYQLIHAGVLFALVQKEGRFFCAARFLFLAGIFLFCGTLYLKALQIGMDATTFAPTGGISFMAGWLMIAFAASKES